jgi:hypothetical protein
MLPLPDARRFCPIIRPPRKLRTAAEGVKLATIVADKKVGDREAGLEASGAGARKPECDLAEVR